MVTGKYADESLRFFKRLIRRKSDLLTFQQYGKHYAIKTYSFNGARDDTLYSQTITLGKGTILPKKCWFFCKKMLTLAKFRGSWYKKVYFLKLHKSVYSRTNFQISSIILTRFRRVCDLGGGGGFCPPPPPHPPQNEALMLLNPPRLGLSPKIKTAALFSSKYFALCIYHFPSKFSYSQHMF